MNRKEIKLKIKAYINAAYQWHETDEGNYDGLLGQEMIELEEEILTAFGLPFMAFQYSDIMQREGFSNENVEKRVQKLIVRLKNEAEIFLLSPIEKDNKILIEARDIFQDVTEVLPMIGITPTPYNCFLYYDKFYRGILKENELLDIFKKTENLDNAAETRIPSTHQALIKNNISKKLMNMGLPFINDYKTFLKYKETTHTWNEHTSNHDLGDYLGLPDVIRLKSFFIKHIYLKDENTCLIKIVIEHGDILIELTLWCIPDMMRIIMLHAKYYSLAVPPLYLMSCTDLEGMEIKLNLKQSVEKNIEIINLNIEIERLDSEDDKIQNSFDYIITSLQSNENIPVINWYKTNNDLPF